MLIGISTKGRWDNLPTLKTLGGIFNKSEIHLFVEPQEFDQYRKRYYNQATIHVIPENDKGLRYTRKFSFNYFGNQTYFILDDDITKFSRRFMKNEKGYWKLIKISPLGIRKMFKAIEQLLIDNPHYGQATISFEASNWLMDGSCKENTRVWCFKCYNGKSLSGKKVKYNINIDPNGFFEDYDHSLEILSSGLKNVSIYVFAFDCVKMGTNKGGQEPSRRKQGAVQKAVDEMHRKWGELVVPFYSEKHGLPEIKVNWKKAYGKAHS